MLQIAMRLKRNPKESPAERILTRAEADEAMALLVDFLDQHLGSVSAPSAPSVTV